MKTTLVLLAILFTSFVYCDICTRNYINFSYTEIQSNGYCNYKNYNSY